MDATTARQAIRSGAKVIAINQFDRIYEGVLEAEWVIVKTRFGAERRSRISAPEPPAGTEWPVVWQLVISFLAPNGVTTLYSSVDLTDLNQMELA